MLNHRGLEQGMCVRVLFLLTRVHYKINDAGLGDLNRRHFLPPPGAAARLASFSARVRMPVARIVHTLSLPPFPEAVDVSRAQGSLACPRSCLEGVATYSIVENGGGAASR